MTKQDAEKIKAAIDRTSIPEEMSTLYALANAVDMMVHNTFQRIKTVYMLQGFRIRENEMLTGITQYCDMVRRAVAQFQARIEPNVVNATFAPRGAAAYDSFQDDSREFCALILLYIDRTARSKEASDTVFATLKSLPSGGFFSDEDIKRYTR